MAITIAQRTQLVELYVAIAGRAPDADGLNYWAGLVAGGQSVVSVAQAMYNTPDAQKLYPKFLSAEEVVSKFYVNVLGRQPDAEGKAYWTGILNQNLKNQNGVADTLFAMINAVKDYNGTDAAGLASKQLFLNKVAVGEHFAVTVGSNDLKKAADTLAAVTADKTSVDAAKLVAEGKAPAQVNQTLTLTTGKMDTIVGGAGNDTINALTYNDKGEDATTFSDRDSIDGGEGKDTLNLYTNFVSEATTGTGAKGQNIALSTNASVKNVEVVNIINDGIKAIADFADASKFVGVTELWQHNKAADVSNLAATTTAGFKNIATDIKVTAAEAATSATIALDGLAEGRMDNSTKTVTKVEVSGAALNTVTVSGTVADAAITEGKKDGKIDAITLDVTAGTKAEAVTIKTDVAANVNLSAEGVKTVNLAAGAATTLTLGKGAPATVDASASTGGVTFDGKAFASTIKTGAGKDEVTIAFEATKDVKAAVLSTAAGDDTLTVNVKDGVTYTVAAGEGNDTVTVNGTVKTTDKIDGGAGTDTISLAAQGAYVADNYIVFNKVVTGFETLKLVAAKSEPQGGYGELDAKQLAANYTTIDLNAGSDVKGVTTQAIVVNGDGSVITADGYKAADATAKTAAVYAGTLNITSKAAGTVEAKAATVKLTAEAGAVTVKTDAEAVNLVAAAGEASTTKAAVELTLEGTAKTASIVLNNGTITAANADAKDAFAVAKAVVAIKDDDTKTADVNEANLLSLTTLTLSGNGVATVSNEATGSKLVTVDASALNSAAIDGKALTDVKIGEVDIAGLNYTSSNTAAETIKLGGGIDKITLKASTYGAVDTITGFNLVASTADAKKIDAAKSDDLILTGVTGAFKLFTSAHTDLELLLKDAADSADQNLVFAFGGDTYIFSDKGTDKLIDSADVLVKLTGTINTDLLIDSLATP